MEAPSFTGIAVFFIGIGVIVGAVVTSILYLLLF